MSDFELEYHLLQGSTAKVPISAQPLVIGRTAAANIVIDWDPSISSRHFQISAQGEQLLLTDLRSTNGTFVNDQRAPECQVRIGDRIRAGNTTFQIRGPQKAVPPSDLGLSSDSVHLSDSDFNLLKVNSPMFFDRPSQVDEPDTANSDPAGTWHIPGGAAESTPTAKASLLGEFSWTLVDGLISEIGLVPGEILEIGRAPESEICLAHDPYVHWTHGLIEWHDDECWLTDLKSVGGTWVDGLHRSSCRLSGAGKIRVGRSEIRFKIHGDSVRPAAKVVQDLVPSGGLDAVKAVPVVVETCLSGLQRMRLTLAEPESTKPKAPSQPARGNPTIAALISTLRQLLAKQQALFVVDFSRIEERPPADLKLLEASPFAELGDFVALNLPVVLTAEEFVQWPILVDELWDRDTCQVFFTELPKAEFLAQVSELRKLKTTPSSRIPPASHGLFWPSILESVLFTNVQQLADKLASLCSLILMEVPTQPGRWQAFGTSAIINGLVAGDSFCVVTSIAPREKNTAEVELGANRQRRGLPR